MELSTVVLSTLAEQQINVFLTSVLTVSCYCYISMMSLVSERGKQCMPSSANF